VEIVYSKEALNDAKYWKQTGDKQTIKKIAELLDDILLHPFMGIGKPEQLKYELSGYWSRRINNEHRLTYTVIEDKIYIFSMRGHYLK
jgi:toxin YoeB